MTKSNGATPMQTIRNARALRRAVAHGRQEFRICLQRGLHSSKSIVLCADGRFEVFNLIDGTVQKLTGRQLYTRSNIGEAMRRGAFVSEAPHHY